MCVVKRCAADAGIGGRVSGHSLRVGSAQSLRDAGATMAELMAAGRWTRAETVARYTREQDAATGVVARLRYGAAPSDGRAPRSARRRATAAAALAGAEVPKRTFKRMRKDAKRATKAARKAEKSGEKRRKAEKSLAQAGKAVIAS